MQRTLNLESLGALADGAAGAIIDKAISEALLDLDDRGDDLLPRKVTIELTMHRRGRDDNQLETRVAAQAKLPPRRTPRTVGNIRHNQGMPEIFFQEHAPDAPDQRTIDEAMESKE